MNFSRLIARLLLVTLIAGFFSFELLEPVPLANAATCSITGTTTIDQAYIDGNNCSTINIAGTFTVTWSGTTDLVGAGDVNITSGTVTFSGAVVLGSTDTMSISLGAVVTHAASDTTGVNITAASLTVAGTINTDGKGCAGGAANDGNGYGPNTSTGVCAITTSGYGDGALWNYANRYGGGGSHGGLGGRSYDQAGTTYGSNTTPTLLGSGGGGGGTNGGAGGGKIRLSISGTLTVNGAISATGSNGVDGTASQVKGGGGSGGSIYITTGTLAGSSTISASGGNGGDGTDNNYDGSGGGGGRVAIYYTTNSGFTLANITATKGLKGASSTAGADGANGSTFILDRITDDGSGTLTITSGLDFVSGGDYTRTNISIASGSNLTCDTFATLDITATSTLAINGATWTCSTVDTLNITAGTMTTSGTNAWTWAKDGETVNWSVSNDLTLNSTTITGLVATATSGGVINMSSAVNVALVSSNINMNVNWTNLASLNIDSGSTINTDGKGCAGGVANSGNGYGPNTSTGVCAITTSGYGDGALWNYANRYGGGGSHGGLGGRSYDQAGTTYGSNTTPTLLGSGGGGGGTNGGAGGGKIRLSISGTLTVNGAISATGSNGVDGTASQVKGGGGSGGSIYITTGTLAGSSTISASGGNGGDGTDNNYDGSGGGGGRVAIYYTTNSGFTLANITATKGLKGASSTAGADGEDGTVYTFQYTAPSTPSVTAPTAGTYNQSVNPTLTSSAYSSNGATHLTSDWKVTSDSGGLTTVWSKTGDASNLTSIVVNASNGTFASGSALANGTLYYAFVRYSNAAGASSWSSAVSFTTIAATNTSTKTWDFGTAGDYTYNSTYATVTGGLGKLLDLGGGTYTSAAPSGLSAWTRLKPITITNSNAALTNFQVMVTVAYDADMQADFDDIRFTDTTGTILNHWLESKTDSTTATFWVKVPSIAATGTTTTLYMYYGNSGVSTTSSASSTFIYGDDFSTDTSANYTKGGHASSSVAVSGGFMNITGVTTNNAVFAPTNQGTPPASYIVEAKMTPPAAGSYSHSGVLGFQTTVAASNNGYVTQYGTQAGSPGAYVEKFTVSQLASSAITYSQGTSYFIKGIFTSGTIKSVFNRTTTATATDSSYTSGYYGLRTYNGNSAVDWFFVRAYAATDPSTSVGAEANLSYDQVSIYNVASAAQTFVALGTFTETRGVTGGQGSTYYNLSLDGTNWKYWNGSNWTTASNGNFNTAADVNLYLPQFTTDIGKGNLYFKSFLIGSNQPVEIDSLAVTYAPLNVSLSAATQSMAENAGTGTVTGQLSGTFPSDVVIPYTVSGTATGGGTDHNLANGNITITAGATTGTATFTVTDDSIDESDETVIVTLGTPNYGTLSGVTEQTVTITDNDTAAITVGAISGNTTEAGVTATFTLVLATQPTADVTIPISSNDTSEGTVSGTSVIFTSLNWNTPQTITVTGVDDSTVDGTVAFSIVNAAASSGDSNYNNLNPSDVSVSCTDNDTAGITLTESSSTTAVTEGSTTDGITFVLTSQPSANVTISFTGDAQVSLSASSLIFTSLNWDTIQTLTITAVDDSAVESGTTVSIVSAVTSADSNYDGLSLSAVSVTVSDDDVASTSTSTTSSSGGYGGGSTYNKTVQTDTTTTSNSTLGLSTPNNWSSGYYKNLIQEKYIVEMALSQTSFFNVLSALFSAPNEGMQRGKAIELMVVLSQFNVGTVSIDINRPTFSDVGSTSSHAAYIEFAAQAGLINGYPDGTFKPDRTVNRAEALKIVFTFNKEDIASELRGLELLAYYELEKNPFSDVDLEQWYAPYIIAAYSHGIIKGYGDGTYKPGNEVSHAEFLKIATLSQNIQNAVELASELE